MSSFHIVASLGATIAAALFSAAMIRMIWPALRRYALARPNARSSHATPTPQGAGLAVIAATLLVVSTAILLDAAPWSPMLSLVFAATIGIAAVGAVDDVRPIPVLQRLALQALAVATVLLAIPTDVQIVPGCPVWIERLVLMLAGLWFVNLVNFMDGLDWMTVAEVVPVSAGLIVLGIVDALPWQATLVAAALGGATLGFAPFNRPVAKVFLGDVGSLPIGLLLGWCLLELAYRQHLAAALLLPLYYLFDATLTLARRAMKREPVWLAHRSHFYQRATDNGFSVLRVDTYVFVLNIFLALLAIASVLIHAPFADIAALLLGAAAVIFVLFSFARPRE
jgi:UDP-N-acetylmuramyl pentapeptide phosphotransferase/UDP-N-acetylglucosamine-1-phosphate transferase